MPPTPVREGMEARIRKHISYHYEGGKGFHSLLLERIAPICIWGVKFNVGIGGRVRSRRRNSREK